MPTIHSALESIVRRSFMAVAAIVGLAHPAGAKDITLAAGSPGGGYFQAAAALAEYIKAEIPNTSTTVMPGGGWANVERISTESKQADVAVIENILSSLAWTGNTPTKKKYDFRMLASVRGPSIAQAVIVKSAGIKSFDEIRQKKIPIRISMFERNQLATTVALDILAEYGIPETMIRSFGGKTVYTSLDEGIRMINDGHADMWLTGGSFYPHPKYIQLGSKAPFQLLPIGKEQATKIASKYG
ncbi:MAG: hypothetical protein FJX42_08980, partial [Alphaproteobacteria bacterium]|nr:hypothetical protein [Alphaproteobacteria bacterium]